MISCMCLIHLYGLNAIEIEIYKQKTDFETTLMAHNTALQNCSCILYAWIISIDNGIKLMTICGHNCCTLSPEQAI